MSVKLNAHGNILWTETLSLLGIRNMNRNMKNIYK